MDFLVSWGGVSRDCEAAEAANGNDEGWNTHEQNRGCATQRTYIKGALVH